ncbi:hypothetical protein [Naasia sp. SYSU D00057]|uniref:hypothetical protein n=1 Tax=Naasia sp. SYSU D00057 TaxID=2817380 RepID=UPI001B316261|nr:hypothetical protein [Naasia sp. SYSU D00057]
MEMVFIHGPAASGKLTTARALAERTGFALFHNHLVVDALLALAAESAERPQLPSGLTIDTTRSDPARTASRILEELHLTPVPEHSPFPS